MAVILNLEESQSALVLFHKKHYLQRQTTFYYLGYYTLYCTVIIDRLKCLHIFVTKSPNHFLNSIRRQIKMQ